MVRLINAEDHRVAEAVAAELPAIARAIDAIAGRMREGGRLIYVGAGTSGRLACWMPPNARPPTARRPSRWWGSCGRPDRAHARVEGAEDDREAGARDVAALGVDRAR